MDIMTYIPWLLAGIVNVVLFRLLVANPWMAARAEEMRMLREGLDQLAGEVRSVRISLHSLGGILLFPDPLEVGESLPGQGVPGVKGEGHDGFGPTRSGWHC